MTDVERKALASVRLTWAPTPQDVWEPQSGVHVHGLHDSTIATVMEGFEDARASAGASPLGVVVRGQAGSGKTHLLGHVREQAQSDGGYFFLIGITELSNFWRSILVQMLENLGRPANATQLSALLWRLATIAHVPRAHRRAIAGEASIDPDTLNSFIEALFTQHPSEIRESRRTLRALVLYAAGDMRLQDIGDGYLQSTEEMVPGERQKWGLGSAVQAPREIVRDISCLLALTGPSVLAVDQIDTLIAATQTKLGNDSANQDDSKIADIAHGLMSLRETLSRTVSILSCTPSAWETIEHYAVSTVRDRFRLCPALKGLPTPDIARTMLEKRFRPHYYAAGFQPPYPTWPVTESALQETPEFTPRSLLQIVDAHLRHCVRLGVVIELSTLGEADTTDRADVPVAAADSEFAALDRRFVELKATATVGGAFGTTTEDRVVSRLLTSGLDAWIRETGAPEGVFQRDPISGAKPTLHARLRRTLDAATEDEEHWSFRAVAASNATAAINRIQKSCTAAGIDSHMPGRRLFLLRNSPWSNGAKTRESIEAFESAGGQTLPLPDDDIRALTALGALLEENSEYLDEWLVARRPAHDVSVFRAALGEVCGTALVDGTALVGGAALVDPEVSQPAKADETAEAAEVDDAVPAVPLGVTVADETPVRVGLEALRKHTAIFAGSGSGKTVLIRRLVEECALQGVSSIVLDPNNDLARLGTEWPDGARAWTTGEQDKATEYFGNTEVVVWTPRRASGRPLSFQPLPDFASVRDDRDEFDVAVDSAVAALAPRALAEGKTAKAKHSQAVLREALEYFGEQPHSGVLDFVSLLEDLPDDVSGMKNGVRIAADLAENLKAAMATDPMFGGEGTPVDPGVLLTPAAGYRARVSVINMAGLSSDSQRQAFVNQLQMALFAWIKKNPAGDRPLGGLFVMDEAQTFAPSGANTACTQSTLALASQARKYGLGLVFATQSPKGLHNRIPGNAATQFYGLLNSPVQIEAAKEMARVKGGQVPDVGKLPAGQFYAAIEGAEFRRTQTPLCLTYHPKSPPTEEEVLALAREGKV
ncbi:helicase HerA domain-containing protein [Rhodococcus sp. NPDC060090]|uniref:helicase HerA domain-containing protein n=1 Tax=Rhodococcus sp. NPDC060090 TaxID=3347056 RepID=UPI003650D71F